jgi:uncharacterized ferredoxin-like protein
LADLDANNGASRLQGLEMARAQEARAFGNDSRIFFVLLRPKLTKLKNMIYDERDERDAFIRQSARHLMAAARTAPKGKGLDIIEIALVMNDDIKRLSDTLYKLSEEMSHAFMERDAENILEAEAILLIGTKPHAHGLNCEHCGYPNCCDKPENTLCALNVIDVGIAIGSAAAMAADLRIDSRIMFSAGFAAQKMGILPHCRMVMALPMSVAAKNPFFDRK